MICTVISLAMFASSSPIENDLAPGDRAFGLLTEGLSLISDETIECAKKAINQAADEMKMPWWVKQVDDMLVEKGQEMKSCILGEDDPTCFSRIRIFFEVTLRVFETTVDKEKRPLFNKLKEYLSKCF